MKRKLLVITMCFMLFISTTINSYANPIITTAIKVAPKVVGTIVSVASTAGLVLDSTKSIGDLTKVVYSRVDSGNFSTYGINNMSDFTNEVKKVKHSNSGGVGKIVLTATLGAVFGALFDDMFLNKNEGDTIYYSHNQIPINTNGRVRHLFKTSEFDGEKVVLNMPYGNIAYIISEDGYGGTNYKYRLSYNGNIVKTETVLNTRSEYGFWNTGTSSKDKFHFFIKSFRLNHNDLGENCGLDGFSCLHIEFPLPTYTMKGNYNGIKDTNNYISPPSSLEDDFLSYGDDIEFDEGGSEPSDPSEPNLPPLPDFDFGKLDFSALGNLFDNFKNKFPFSIPFDLYNLLNIFVVDPIAPKFEFPFYTESLTIDLTIFDEWANIIRMFFVFGWIFVLFSLTKKVGD